MTAAPHRCPICDGRGVVAAAFYDVRALTFTTTALSSEPCRACNGTGLVESPLWRVTSRWPQVRP